MGRNNNLFDLIMNNIREKVDYSPIGAYYNDNLLPKLEEFNRADTVNMTPDEMNKFRHFPQNKSNQVN